MPSDDKEKRSKWRMSNMFHSKDKKDKAAESSKDHHYGADQPSSTMAPSMLAPETAPQAVPQLSDPASHSTLNPDSAYGSNEPRNYSANNSFSGSDDSRRVSQLPPLNSETSPRDTINQCAFIYTVNALRCVLWPDYNDDDDDHDHDNYHEWPRWHHYCSSAHTESFLGATISP
ncbi:hypothetical protein K490DRAFT_58346 [Saccharata proteae CBS 121410]|uniref:Uncharacterized protein n=1 Tax=Saccharata proteae CBS 121410 TaxID=1314787 RepID=A0A9P4HT90_9PEZI|nr:hypothetical protein K490DRAFT_58346 [Saccharata proteae CBS 121410]